MNTYQIDQTDKDIIWALDKNARFSATQIGQLIGVSKQVVSYRLRRLTKLGILDLFSVIISKPLLGYFHCQIYLNLNENISRAEIEKKLLNITGLHWEALTKGDYNLVIFFLVKNLQECQEINQKIINSFESQISSKEILLTAKTHFLNHGYITHEPKVIVSTDSPSEPIKLKARDYELINALKEKGRMQINKLAEKINMAPITIRQRIAYLKRKGVITAFKTRINHSLLGFKHYMILISLSNLKLAEKENINKSLINLGSTIRLTETIGKWDLILDLILDQKSSPEDTISPIVKNFKVLEINQVLPINTVIYK